jgi:hypothetical protein
MILDHIVWGKEVLDDGVCVKRGGAMGVAWLFLAI